MPSTATEPTGTSWRWIWNIRTTSTTFTTIMLWLPNTWQWLRICFQTTIETVSSSVSHVSSPISIIRPNTLHNLTLYKQLGLVVTKIHRVLEFKQEAWLKSYIEFNTNKWKAATSDFEKDFFKLLSNSVYGKSMESPRKRVNIEIVNSEKRIKKVLAKPTLKNLQP